MNSRENILFVSWRVVGLILDVDRCVGFGCEVLVLGLGMARSCLTVVLDRRVGLEFGFVVGLTTLVSMLAVGRGVGCGRILMMRWVRKCTCY